MKILMTGATGLIGRELGKALVAQGHEVVVVSRKSAGLANQLAFPCEIIEANLTKDPIRDVLLNQIEAVIHLAGEPVAQRWNQEIKERIYSSRVQGTQNLISSFVDCPRLKVFLAASAIGIYGDRSEETLTENSLPGQGFLVDVTRDWEAVTELAERKKILGQTRICQLRIGVVLSPSGKALDKMRTPFRLGVGGPLGSGQQWMSWVHIQDVVSAFLFCLNTSQCQGAFNLVAPEPVRNVDFSRTLAQQFGRRLGPPVPQFAIRLLFGEMAQVVLASQRVLPQKLLATGFTFKHGDLSQALEDCCHFFKGSQEVKVYEQFLANKKVSEVFPFFADAKNLEKITPPFLHFRIVDQSPGDMREGFLINYKLKIHGVPVRWRTEIIEWRPQSHFVDNQIKGPYRRWHHTHTFQQLGGGVLMTDRVLYKLPLSWLGWGFANWLVSKDVDNIFNYRRKVVAEL